MLNPLNFISKIIKTPNEKELIRLGKIVSRVNNLEQEFATLKDEDFPLKTSKFKERIKINYLSYCK